MALGADVGVLVWRHPWVSQRVSAPGLLAGMNVMSTDFKHVFCMDEHLSLHVGKTECLWSH